MGKAKTDYARYTFAFASDIQKLADEKHVRVVSFNTKATYDHGRKSCDLLTVRFLVKRPDRDEEKSLESVINEIEVGLADGSDVDTDEESEKVEVES